MDMLKNVRRRQSGFSLFEMLVAMFIIMILVAVVILMASGFFSKAGEAAWETDQRIMKSAVDAFTIQAMEFPTEDGRLPYSGEYAPIDFDASFTRDNDTLSFYPHFISRLPKHADEGVWRLNSAAQVSIDMDLEEY